MFAPSKETRRSDVSQTLAKASMIVVSLVVGSLLVLEIDSRGILAALGSKE